MGNGRLMEYEDGTVAYIRTGEFGQSWRVPIDEVTGFSTVKGGKMLERTFQVFGSGALLASVSVGHGTAEKIEAWFRAHSRFRAHAPVSAEQVAITPTPGPTTLSSQLIADELRKLADLRAEGILTDQEFETQKTRLLA